MPPSEITAKWTPHHTVTCLVVLGVISLMMVFEPLFYFWVVSPAIRRGLCTMIKKIHLRDRVGSEVLTGLLQQRVLVPGSVAGDMLLASEQGIISLHNQSGVLFSVLLAALPMCLFAGTAIKERRNLSGEMWLSVAKNVGFVVACLIAFQLLFYQFSLRYFYSGSKTLTQSVLHAYNQSTVLIPQAPVEPSY